VARLREVFSTLSPRSLYESFRDEPARLARLRGRWPLAKGLFFETHFARNARFVVGPAEKPVPLWLSTVQIRCLKDTFSRDYSSLHIADPNALSGILLRARSKSKCHINGIAAESKNTGSYKLVRVDWINTNAEALAKRNKADKQENQSRKAKEHASP
jgi:hypothetical protein